MPIGAKSSVINSPDAARLHCPVLVRPYAEGLFPKRTTQTNSPEVRGTLAFLMKTLLAVIPAGSSPRTLVPRAMALRTSADVIINDSPVEFVSESLSYTRCSEDTKSSRSMVIFSALRTSVVCRYPIIHATIRRTPNETATNAAEILPVSVFTRL